MITLLLPSRRSLHDIREGFLTVLALQDVLDEQAAFCICLVGAASDTIKAIISDTHGRSVRAFAMGRSQNTNRLPGIQRRLEEVGGAAGRFDRICMTLAVGARVVNGVSVTVSKLSARTLHANKAVGREVGQEDTHSSSTSSYMPATTTLYVPSTTLP